MDKKPADLELKWCPRRSDAVCLADDFYLVFRCGEFTAFQLFTINPNRYIPFGLKEAKAAHAWLTKAIPHMKKAESNNKKHLAKMKRKYG